MASRSQHDIAFIDVKVIGFIRLLMSHIVCGFPWKGSVCVVLWVDCHRESDPFSREGMVMERLGTAVEGGGGHW